MQDRRQNTQLFALPTPPPARIDIGAVTYRLTRVFKHDFYAATSLYESSERVEIPRIVVKLYRTRPFCGLPMGWLGNAMREHEKAIYAALEGIQGLPRWVGSLGRAGFAIEYIDAVPLDHARPPAGYFDRMRQLFDAVHARGVVYVDANKRSNMLVGRDGSPYLVDFQIALRLGDDWPWPIRALPARIARYLRDRDIYHLYKHKRRIAPEELTSEQEKISRRRGNLHRLHRKITKPYRSIRRGFLRRQHHAGRLVSPSMDMEDHRQPEKETWRKT